MTTAKDSRTWRTIPLLIAVFALNPLRAHAQDGRPVADAGSPRYAATEPVQLDGTGSYDPDDSGTLSYTWRQISGPSVAIIDANTAAPMIVGAMVPTSGRDPTLIPADFAQTLEVQELEFELVVSDGELKSAPDTVKVVIVPFFGASTLKLENAPFDPNKPTVIYFGGGDCVNGLSGQPWNGGPAWTNKANIIGFPTGYTRDSSGGRPTYYKYGDMIIAYLSAVAPEYGQSIQTIGWSTGADPAIDVGIRLNGVYGDARYAVNHVTQLDGGCRITEGWSVYLESVELFLSCSVGGEQGWIDHYYGILAYPSLPAPRSDILYVQTGLDHNQVRDWYRNSPTRADMNNFNGGLVGGAYWSVIGPGKNLQLSPEAGVYYFLWKGSQQSGAMSFLDESKYPGRLPEPVTLVGPEDGAFVDADGTVFSCEESENTIGYQLLFGSDPYRVMDYIVVSDTPNPPEETISEFPFEKTWWTVRAYDSFGSTIYADPRCINAEVVSPPPVLPHVLHIYDNDIAAAESFQSLLADYRCSADLIDIADVATAPLNSYDLIIVGNDTGSTADWGSIESVAVIEDSGKPVLGLGEGGYAFFGKLGLSIGWPNGMHSDDNSLYAIEPNSPLFSTPYPIDIPDDGILKLYTESSLVTLYLSPVPETVTVLGGSVAYSGYYTLALEHDRYVLWGFTESPLKMTEDGKRLFINTVIRTANTAWGR